MGKSRRLRETLQRLTEVEEAFLTREFLAPVFHGSVVQVRLAGVICRLSCSPADFQGFGIFRPQSYTEANLVRTARLAERQRYLELFPRVRLILFRKEENYWLAFPAQLAQPNPQPLPSQGRGEGVRSGLVPVRLVEEGQPFELIVSRFDGTQFWYAGPDPHWDPSRGAYLRQAHQKETDPDQLQRSGLTPEERQVYWLAFQATEKARRSKEEKRLRAALAHAGAEFKQALEREDVYTITFEVDGRQHVSVVSKQDLSVQVAGICLSGLDEVFDLHSLVGVIRQAQGEGGFVRVGLENQGMEEEQYWQVHPPPPRE